MKSAEPLQLQGRIKVLEPLRRRRPEGGFGLASLWSLYGLTFRQHLHGKRWIVMAMLFLLPVGLAVLIRATAPDMPGLGIEFIVAFMFVPQTLLPLAALVYASGIIQDEQEDQTLTYLLIRPIPKWAIYAVKMAATCMTTVLLVAVFTCLTYAVIYLGGDMPVANVLERCFKTVGIHSLAVVSYCSLFGLISLFTRRSLVVGILYIIVVEGLLANLPFSIRLLTIIYYTRLIAYRSLDFVIVEHGRREDIAASGWQLDLKADPHLLEHPSLATCWMVLIFGSLACTAIAALICSRREFYVKTPETT